MRIAHLSDIHFGRIAHPGIVEDIIYDVNNAGVDLIAISGDLTQRANARQFRACVDMLNAFTPPLLVVPGNHDVFPWWRPISRLSRPLSLYKQYIGRDMVRSYETEGVAVLGINSAHGKTIKGGKIEPEVSDTIQKYFSTKSSDTFKVLMLHHHLKQLNALMPHDTVKNADLHLEMAIQSGVNLILCGHVHISHVESLDRESAEPFVIASAGTATSSRGRRSNRRKNYYNIIDIFDTHFTIEERAYKVEEGIFYPTRKTQFDRP